MHDHHNCDPDICKAAAQERFMSMLDQADDEIDRRREMTLGHHLPPMVCGNCRHHKFGKDFVVSFKSECHHEGGPHGDEVTPMMTCDLWEASEF